MARHVGNSGSIDPHKGVAFNPSKLNEDALQATLADRLATLPAVAYRRLDAHELDRDLRDVLDRRQVAAALVRLNPYLAPLPDTVEQVVGRLERLAQQAQPDLIAANREFTRWLRGEETINPPGMPNTHYEPVRLVDYDNPAANDWVLTRETGFTGVRGRHVFFDLVLWVNGIPLVVIETKSPYDPDKSWLNAAKDIASYQKRAAPFFVPNLLCAATAGRGELHIGAVGEPHADWMPWGETDYTATSTGRRKLTGLRATLHDAERLLAPRTLLDILHHYVMYTSDGKPAPGPGSDGRGSLLAKLIPRYPQVEAVGAIVERVRDPNADRGLIAHHQGAGKTHVMRMASVRVFHDPANDAPTVLVVLDRVDLIDQTVQEFADAGIERVKVARTSAELRELLADQAEGGHDQRGIVITTIYRFKSAGRLNARRNITVLVDEAHRTQEGDLGQMMRAALPNATFIGLTGTPIATTDRNTYDTFGHERDHDRVLNGYSMEQSIRDGVTVPLKVALPALELTIRQEDLDAGFAEMTDQAGLDDEQKELLARRGSRLIVLLKAPDRINKIAKDAVAHYLKYLRPNGLKAMFVAADREACALYEEPIARELAAHGLECRVVISTSSPDKDDELFAYRMTRSEEQQIKKRFKSVDDPLAVLIVTAKLLTGFNAPICGAVYLDKALRAHTLFQTMTRCNRPWRNPHTDFRKQFGMVVPYLPLQAEIQASVQQRGDAGTVVAKDVDGLLAEFHDQLRVALARFDALPVGLSPAEESFQVEELLAEPQARDAFRRDFMRLQGIWEFLAPDPRLRDRRNEYRWLAKQYAMVRDRVAKDRSDLLWERFGAKTDELISQAVEVTVDGQGREIELDADAIQRLTAAAARLGSIRAGDGPAASGDDDSPATEEQIRSVEDVMRSIEERISRRLDEGQAPAHYESIARKLEELRRMRLVNVVVSVRWLKDALSAATELFSEERGAGIQPGTEASVLPETNEQALTQILRECSPQSTPEMIKKLVAEVDRIATDAQDTRWKEGDQGDKVVRRQIKMELARRNLSTDSDLFRRIYEYVREHY